MDAQNSQEQLSEEKGDKDGNYAVVSVTQTVITIAHLLFNLEKKSTKKSKRQVGIEELRRVIEEAGVFLDIEADKFDAKIEDASVTFRDLPTPVLMFIIETDEPKPAVGGDTWKKLDVSAEKVDIKVGDDKPRFRGCVTPIIMLDLESEEPTVAVEDVVMRVDIEAAELDIQVEAGFPAFRGAASPIVMLNIETEEPKAADISPAQFDSQPGTPKLPWEQVVIPNTLDPEPVMSTIDIDTKGHRGVETGVQVSLPGSEGKGSVIPDFISDEVASSVNSAVAGRPKQGQANDVLVQKSAAIATQTGTESQEVEIHLQGLLVGRGIDITSAYATVVPSALDYQQEPGTSDSPEFSSKRIRTYRRAAIQSESPLTKAPPPSSHSPKRKKKRKNRLIVNPILRHLGADSSSVFHINTKKSKAVLTSNRFTYNGKSSGRESSITLPPIFTTEVSRSYTDCKTTSSGRMFSVNLTKYQAAHINYETDLLEKSFSPFRCTKVVKLPERDSTGVFSQLDETPRSDSESPMSRHGGFQIKKRSLRRL